MIEFKLNCILSKKMSGKVLAILFWNVNGKDLTQSIGEIANNYKVDVIILLECPLSSSTVLTFLKSSVSSAFFLPHFIKPEPKFQLFSRDERLDLSEVYAEKRFSIRNLYYKNRSVFLGLLHIVDRWTWGDRQQFAEVEITVTEIRKRESEAGHDRTILIGDFNMNPFDDAMNSATGFNAMMTVRCASRGSRTVQDREYPFFYNPMWGFLGDRTPGPPGTFFHSNSSRGTYGWNLLDQVLIRPSVLECFADVKILDSTGITMLANEGGRPRVRSMSDHFPILLQLK